MEQLAECVEVVFLIFYFSLTILHFRGICFTFYPTTSVYDGPYTVPTVRALIAP